VTDRLWLTGVLVLTGAGWGMTQPLGKIATSTGHGPLGLVFWQLAIGALVLGAVTFARGNGLPLGAPQLRLYLVIALIGTVFPNAAFYAAIAHLPSGIVSLLLSLVPMLAFPIALAMGVDRASLARVAGLALGLGGVALIVLPGTALPEPGQLWWVPVALIAPLFYALEGNVVAKWGRRGLDPVQLLFGASVVGTIVALPLAVGSGQWIDPRPPWGAPELALTASAVIHGIVYAVYVWLVGRAGPVFAVQVSYLVTGFGLLWAMWWLGERYAGAVWMAAVLMALGLALVTPRERTGPKSALAPGGAPSQTGGAAADAPARRNGIEP
jgi:drug/metabolite transporter (DMT)-like permease